MRATGSRTPPGRQIVVGVDGSAASAAAVRWAAARALLDRSAGAELLVLGTSRLADQADQPSQAIGPVARACLRRAHCPVVMVAPDNPQAANGSRWSAGILATADGRRSALSGQAFVPLG